MKLLRRYDMEQRLQERVDFKQASQWGQKRKKRVEFKVIREFKRDGEQRYQMQVKVGGKVMGSADGTSKSRRSRPQRAWLAAMSSATLRVHQASVRNAWPLPFDSTSKTKSPHMTSSLSCTDAGHRFCWNLNRTLDTQLTFHEEVEAVHKRQPPTRHCVWRHTDELGVDLRCHLEPVAGWGNDPQPGHFDFLLRIESMIGEKAENLMDQLRSMRRVAACFLGWRPSEAMRRCITNEHRTEREHHVSEIHQNRRDHWPGEHISEVLGGLIQEGVNVIRLNFSHGDYETHATTVERVKAVDAKLGTHTALLADMQGEASGRHDGRRLGAGQWRQDDHQGRRGHRQRGSGLDALREIRRGRQGR